MNMQQNLQNGGGMGSLGFEYPSEEISIPGWSDDEEEGTEEQEFPKHDSNSDQSEELTYLRIMLEDLALHESLASALSQMNVSSIEDLIHAVQHSPDELRAIGMTDQDLLNINNYVDKHVEDEGESTANSTQPASIVGV